MLETIQQWILSNLRQFSVDVDVDVEAGAEAAVSPTSFF